MVRRSKLEIYFDLLKIIDSGIDKPTQIMYKSNSSWEVIQEIMKRLIQGGFIKKEFHKKNQRYYITEKGRNALTYHCKSVKGLVKDPLQSAVNDFYIR